MIVFGERYEGEINLDEIKASIFKSNSDSPIIDKILDELREIDENAALQIRRDILFPQDYFVTDITPLGRMGRIVWNSSDTSIGDRDCEYNTWPFGAHGGELKHVFVAGCYGSGEYGQLSRLFRKVSDQSKKMINAFGDNDAKAVVIYTDKWDAMKFQKYEAEFLNNAINHNVWYFIILVTDYGYAEVPFLPRHRGDLKKYKGMKIIQR